MVAWLVSVTVYEPSALLCVVLVVGGGRGDFLAAKTVSNVKICKKRPLGTLFN